MKKSILYISMIFLAVVSSCKRDDSSSSEVSIETQNSYDDEAINKFLEQNYFDSQGVIKEFSSTSTADDNEPKLSTYNPVKLPSGVIYIVRPNAQPSPGTVIGESDIIRLMGISTHYIAKKVDNVVRFDSEGILRNTIATTGAPEVDPFYYYPTATNSSMGTSGKSSSYYQIEGFREGLQHFLSYDQDDSSNYNLQGVIIVPSRAAYARDENIFDTNYTKFKDRSFVFNFQVYKTKVRPK